MYNMKKKILFLCAIVVIISLILGLLNIKSKKNNNYTEDKVILFVRNDCPHCQIVEQWLEDKTAIKTNSGLVFKEVSLNKDNSQLLLTSALQCQLDSSQGLGVPFLFDQGKCIIGDQPIIDYLGEKYL